MFSGFMVDTWVAASLVAVVAGLVGFLVVLRGAAFLAHAVPNGAFAGAAAANLLGWSPLLGLGAFALAGAFGISWLARRGRSDTATALTLVLMLGLGSLFLSFSREYASAIFALLFGDLIGVSPDELLPVVALGLGCAGLELLLFRRLLLASVTPETAAARGLRLTHLDLAFALLVAVATTVTVPVVGAFLMFSLMVAPAAAARALAPRPGLALLLSVLIALLVVWAAVAAAYLTNWPVGFFVGAFGGLAYGLARVRQARSGTAARAPRRELARLM